MTTAQLQDVLHDTLSDDSFLIELLSDLTSQPEVQVRSRFERELSDLGSQVRESFHQYGLVPYQWTERLEEFYRQTDGFLFETLVWNRNPTKLRMRQWIIEFLRRNSDSPNRILTFGDGLGIDSVALAVAGHNVDYYEVSQPCRQFAARFGDRVGVRPNMIDELANIPLESYDAVVCLDVLEHVPQPADTVGLLARFLRPGGRLFVHAPFWYLHPAVVTHLESNRKYSGDLHLYRQHGLEPVDGTFFWVPLALEKKRSADSQARTLPFPTHLRLGVSGWLLAVARWWCFPHVWIARSLLNQ